MNCDLFFTYIVYNSILILSILFSYYAEFSKTNQGRILSRILVFTTLFIPAAIRYNIGTDYENYTSSFYSLNNIDFEYGFHLLNLIISYFELSPHWIFVTSSLLTYSLITFFIGRKNYAIIITFYTLLLYLWSYSIVRQAISISFIIVAVDKLTNGKSIEYFILIILASLFHYSSLLMFPVFFLKYIYINRFIKVIIISILFISIFYNGLAINIITSELFAASLYSDYLNTSYIKESDWGSGIGIIVSLSLPIYCLFFDNISKSIISTFLANTNLIYLAAYILSLNIYIFNRLSSLFVFAPIMMLGYVLSSNNHKYKKEILYFLIITNIIMYERIIYNSLSNLNSGLGITPYITIFH